tara:strand:- start:9695 stop:10555 length:861 start_codon:yes stop_codon:yes gene_type:complete
MYQKLVTELGKNFESSISIGWRAIDELAKQVSMEFLSFVKSDRRNVFHPHLYDSANNKLKMRYGSFKLSLYVENNLLNLKICCISEDFGFDEPLSVVVHDFNGDWDSAYEALKDRLDARMQSLLNKSKLTIGEQVIRRANHFNDSVSLGALSYGGFGLVVQRKGCSGQYAGIVNKFEADYLAQQCKGDWTSELTHLSDNRPFREYMGSRSIVPVIKEVEVDGVDAYSLDDGDGAKTYAIFESKAFDDGSVQINAVEYLEKNITLPRGVANVVPDYLQRYINNQTFA